MCTGAHDSSDCEKINKEVEKNRSTEQGTSDRHVMKLFVFTKNNTVLYQQQKPTTTEKQKQKLCNVNMSENPVCVCVCV